MQEITANKTNTKVASRIVRTTSGGNRISKRLRSEHGQKDSAQVFRLSMLDTSKAYQAMPSWANKTLFAICNLYCDRFNPHKELLPDEISSYMIDTVKEHFCIDRTTCIGVTDDKIVVHHSLQYDFYNYEVSCVSKLKSKAKPLYIAFSTLLTTIGFQRLELDRCCFYEEYIHSQMEYEGRNKIYVKALERFKKGSMVYSDFERSALEPTDALKVLKAYREKKQEYLRISVFLSKWLGERFFFMDAAPYQFYEVGENHDAMEEHCEIPYRFGFYTTKGTSFDTFLNEENQNTYNNNTLCEPCWSISEETTGEALKQNIIKFEEFSLELLEVLQLIQKL